MLNKLETLSSVYLREDTRHALDSILTRSEEATPEDVVAMSIEVFNVLTEHLSHKGSKVILHTPGESPKTLHLKTGETGNGKGIRTVYKSLNPPKTNRL